MIIIALTTPKSALSAIIIKHYVPVSEGPTTTQNKARLIDVLKNKATYLLIIPNLLRGIASGIFALSAVIMLGSVTSSESVSSFLSTILAISGTLACFIFSLATKRLSCPSLILLGALIFLPSFALITLFDEIGFMILYFISSIGMMFVDYGVPAYLYMSVPSNIMARYSSIRMLTHNAGIAIGSALAGAMLSSGFAFGVTVIAGVLELLLGISYFVFAKRYGTGSRYNV